MTGEILTIEGLEALHHRSNRMDPKKMFNNLKADFKDLDNYKKVGVAAVSGAVGLYGAEWVSGKLNGTKMFGIENPKYRSLARNGATAILGLIAAVATERYYPSVASAVAATVVGRSAKELAHDFVPQIKRPAEASVLAYPRTKGAGALPDGSVGRHFTDADLQNHLAEVRA